MRTVLYDLAKDVVTWDFVTWAVNVRELGYRKVNFQIKNIPETGRKWIFPKQMRERCDNFMLPATRALGMDYGFDPVGDRIGSPHYYLQRPDFKRLTVSAPRHGRHTITLREVPYKAYRNSNRDIWLRFAEKINAIVIEDYSRVKITFEERFRLYAGAVCNWGVTNGPLAAVFVTPYPVKMFCCEILDRHGFSGHHISPGGQIPISLPNQNLIWGEITLENLLREYERGAEPIGSYKTCRCALAGWMR